MKTLVLLALTLFTSASFAQTTPIQADLRCEERGGGLAIKMPSQRSPAKVWQSDMGQPDGLELKVTKFEVQRCPGCFYFEATLFDIPVRGKASSGLINYEIYSAESKEWSTVLKNVRCLSATSKR